MYLKLFYKLSPLNFNHCSQREVDIMISPVHAHCDALLFRVIESIAAGLVDTLLETFFSHFPEQFLRVCDNHLLSDLRHELILLR
jgi:hypothetical protein